MQKYHWKVLGRWYMGIYFQELGIRLDKRNFLSYEANKTCFKKLSKFFQEMEREHRLVINPIEFIRAQILFFREGTYPAHLIASCAYSIYQKYREQHFPLVQRENTNDIKNMVQYLSTIWNIPKKQILSQMIQTSK